MTLAIILVVAAIVALVVILRLAVLRKIQISTAGSLAQRIRPIDIEAFRNLVNPGDDEFLRRQLSPEQFRLVRRARLRAMASYIHEASSNAAFLVRIGQAALATDNARTRAAAEQLVNDALLLRRNATFALFRIYVALAWPNSGAAAARVFESYEQLSGTAMLLGRLQNPAVPLRVSARF